MRLGGIIVGRWVAAACAALAISAPRSASSKVLAVRFGGDMASTRVVIDLDAPVTAPQVSRDGGVLTLALNTDLDELSGGAGRGLVAAWSVAPSARGGRLRFEIAQGAVLTHRFSIPPSAASPNYRYVIDLGPTAEPHPVVELTAVQPVMAYAPPPVLLAPAWVTRAALEPRRDSPTKLRVRQTPDAPMVRPRDGRRRVIVVDAGHGGHDSGALGGSQAEKDLTLAAAHALKTRLERSGLYRVVLTRDTDVFVPLEARVKIAREGGADLFISLHADSAGADTTTHGASVYTLSDSGGGRVHYVLGRDEWFSKVANRRDPGVSQILLDLTQRNTRNRSATFADLLLDRLAGRVDLLPRGHRDAGYFVLLAPDVPAALLEMGFITNPQDESRLADPAQRARMMDGVADAIDAYFAEGRRVALR